MTVEDDGGRRQRPRQRHHEAVLDLLTDDDVVDGRFEAAVRSITETAADIVDATRAGVWLFADDGDRIRCVDHYDTRTDDHTAGMELVAADYPAYFEALHSHRSISAVDARDDPRTTELSPDYLEPLGMESMLDATLRAEGDVIGVARLLDPEALSGLDRGRGDGADGNHDPSRTPSGGRLRTPSSGRLTRGTEPCPERRMQRDHFSTRPTPSRYGVRRTRRSTRERRRRTVRDDAS
ncbi:GAF domain-containing protein [Natronorubrum sp. FCH18a]|uniref:GAF domain-containing protein n=1 Tax=Natronorubrum sp. FCH18a TaxID=3447018 RepID=UPI003F516CB9